MSIVVMLCGAEVCFSETETTVNRGYMPFRPYLGSHPVHQISRRVSNSRPVTSVALGEAHLTGNELEGMSD